MYKNMTFDPQKDLEPIVLIGKSPVIIVARPAVQAKTLKELIEFLKANPDKLNAGYPGNGTLGHITGVLFQQRAQVKMGGAQYRGSAAIINDLLGGHIDIAMDSMAPYVSNINEGNLRALAIAGTSRWSGLPDVPTVAESGLPGFEASVWYALLAPSGHAAGCGRQAQRRDQRLPGDGHGAGSFQQARRAGRGRHAGGPEEIRRGRNLEVGADREGRRHFILTGFVPRSEER